MKGKTDKLLTRILTIYQLGFLAFKWYINTLHARSNIQNGINSNQWAYQEKNPPLWKNFNIRDVSDQPKLIEHNSSKEKTKYLKPINRLAPYDYKRSVLYNLCLKHQWLAILMRLQQMTSLQMNSHHVFTYKPLDA